MPNIDRAYVLVALGWLIAGTLFGFWMGASNNPQYVSVHVAMLLPGFVTLAIYGLIYRQWPELKQGPLARLQFLVAALSLPALVAGAWQTAATGAILIVALASAAFIAAAVLMAALFWTRTRPA